MKVLGIFSIFVLFCIGVFFIKTYQPTMQIIYPDQCHFIMDELFSSSFQKELQDYVVEKYQIKKDPDYVIDQITQSFSHIAHVDAFICKSDKLCFSFQSADPLFLLNNQVVCQNNQLVNSDYFSANVYQGLRTIHSSYQFKLNAVQDFFNQVQKDIFNDFSVEWINDQEIVLQQKNKPLEKLLFSVDSIPQKSDIENFYAIKDKHAGKGKRKKVYDFRFKGQVIVS